MATIDDKELGNGITKITMYENEEGIFLDDIKTKLTELTNLYKTSNTDKLSNLNSELREKFKKVNKIHNNYIDILTKTIIKYKNTSKNVTTMFTKIDTNIEVK